MTAITPFPVGSASDPGDAPADALLDLYLSMRPDLERFLTARLGQSASAQDVYQAMYLRLRIAQRPAPLLNPRAFLYKIAVNLANDYRRGTQRREGRDRQWLESVAQRVGEDFISEQVDADAAIDAKRRLASIVSGINDMPPKCRQTFVLHKLEGLSQSEVAVRLGIAKKTVEKHMKRALKHLLAREGRHGILD